MFGFGKAREGVFQFYDGSRWRAADPIRVHRLINEYGGKEWDSWVAQLDQLSELDPKFKLSEPIQDSRNAAGMDAVMKVSELARKVFGVKQVDDGGLTDAESVKLFGDFLLYAAQIAERFRSFRKPPPATASADGGSVESKR